MVAKRIELRTLKGNSGDDSDSGFSFKDIDVKRGKFGGAAYWVVGIIIILGIYHCYETYQEQVENQSLEKEEAMNCMYQFKTQDCNPMNLNDKCK